MCGGNYPGGITGEPGGITRDQVWGNLANELINWDRGLRDPAATFEG